MKYAFLLTIIFLTSCHKEPVTTQDRILGSWRQVFSPYAVYTFTEGTATREIVDFGTVIWAQRWNYTTDGNTLNMVEMPELEEKKWIVSFQDDDTATLNDGGAILVNIKRWP